MNITLNNYITPRNQMQRNSSSYRKKAIEGISNTQGFSEIRDYRRRVVVACNDRLRTIKSEDIKTVQGELNIAMEFLQFLDNMAYLET